MPLPHRRITPAVASHPVKKMALQHISQARPHNDAIPGNAIGTGDFSHDTSLDFGDGDTFDLNEMTYNDPSPTTQSAVSDDKDFSVAHKSTPQVDDTPYIPQVEDGLMPNMDEEEPEDDEEHATESNQREDEHPTQGEESSGGGEDGVEPDDEPQEEGAEDEREQPEDDGNEQKDGPSWFQNFKNRVKSEIGGNDDDGNKESEPQKLAEEPKKAAKNAGNGVKKAANKLPWFLRRKIHWIRSIAPMLVILWVICNVIPAVANKSTAFDDNEGTVSISGVSYSDNHVSFIETNRSDLIAHVSSTATVKAYKPSLHPLSSLVAPKTVMTCSTVGNDINPSASQSITLTCSGERGFWMRPIVKVNSR